MNEAPLRPYRIRVLRAVPATAPWRELRRLRQRDRLSAKLASLHGTASVLAGAQTVVDIGWARTSTCATCAAGSPGDAARGCCLVCAMALAGGASRTQPNTATQAALDLVWRSMHTAGHRPVHWNAAPVMHALQVHEVNRWNDRTDITSADVSALLRKARRRADVAWQTASNQPGSSAPTPGELTH